MRSFEQIKHEDLIGKAKTDLQKLTSTAHVSESTLPGTAGPATADTGDARHGASGSPGTRHHALAGVDVDGVRLALVLVHVRVHELHDVGTERSRHNGRERGLSRLFAGSREDGDEGTSCHGCKLARFEDRMNNHKYSSDSNQDFAGDGDGMPWRFEIPVAVQSNLVDPHFTLLLLMNAVVSLL